MDQIFEKFGLHLNLLIAQIINFGVLFFVLYKLAYKPILKVLDQRREKIENSLKQAKEIEERTLRLEEDIKKRLAETKQQAEGILAEAKEIAEKVHNDGMTKTNQEIAVMLAKTKADIAQQKEGMMTDIKDYVVQTSVEVVKKILSEKLDEKTRERVVIDSIRELASSKK
ncbi:F0F1 ATP synthase subunit B [Candidatus Peregrinibacteria bacterium]|nr:F0F1 ATP synthase subunit B [Candidatus Peregrinibacteria bacterium]